MMIRIWTAVVLATASSLFAADSPKQRVEASHTERMDFPPHGTLRLTNSVGVLTVETWSRPDVEITTIKSTKTELDPADRDKGRQMLDKVRITSERRGDEFVVATAFPYRRFPPPYPFSKDMSFYPAARDVNFDLEYHIKVPADTRIVVDHTIGQINIDGAPGDIQAKLTQGEITLHLPQDERYDIRASSNFGHVDNDYAGEQKRRGWALGHRVVNADPMAHRKLNLKVGFGNIVILKTRIPPEPAPLTAASNQDHP